MNYTGEHLLPGQLGHFFAVLSFVVSLVATIGFYKSNKSLTAAEKESWFGIAKAAFLLETICVIGIIGCIYYILSNNYFEYKYAWEHSDSTMQIQYVFSCLWEGQEGSFLLWSFWHCVLGWLIIWRVKEWRAPVLTVVSFAQLCIASMLLGIFFFGFRVGHSPFVLLRNEGILDNAPFLHDASGNLSKDYVALLYKSGGSGLNALLQNYWMTIHPPVLFLGFASTIVPFAFAYAGLVNKDHTWTKAVLPWSLFSVAVLGTGIMMGAAWAYESLTFGGFWAWDPVENASLVPWLVMVAGLHTNLIFRHSGYSLKSTYIFYVLSFILILYSTFLTRSGILGDTSVHAFTGEGMNQQLLTFLSLFVWLPAFVQSGKKGKLIVAGIIALVVLLTYTLPETVTAGLWLFSLVGFLVAFGIQVNIDISIPSVKKEEDIYSREFWMFIGALVFFLGAIIIITQTSLPVINKAFNQKMAEASDAEFSYNKIQIFIAIIIGVLTAITQYLKYKQTPKSFFLKKVAVPTIISLVISLAISFFGNIDYDKKGIGFLAAIHIAIFAAVYAIVGNGAYIWIGLKGKMKNAGAAIAHVGFGLVLLAVLISSSKKEILSWNTTGVSPLQDTEESNKIAGRPAENITLFKGVETDMGKYMVTYSKDSFDVADRKKYFVINFKSKDGTDAFNVYPDVLRNTKGQEGFSPNPDSKHYLNRDIFTYVTSWIENNKQEDTAQFKPTTMKAGDTAFYSNGLMILNKVDINKAGLKGVKPGEMTISLDMEVISKSGSRYPVSPAIAITNDSIMRSLPDTVVAQSLVLNFSKIVDPKEGKMEVGIKESGAVTDLITLKVLLFPFINLLWIGVIVMVVGTLLSVRQQVVKLRTKKQVVVRKPQRV